MIDQQQQIDHDEHAAVTAEAEAEAAAELAHEQQQRDLIAALLTLADDSTDKARRLVRALANEVEAQRMPGPSTYLFAKRAQAVAHLAARSARTLDGYRGYDLRGQVEALLRAATAGDQASGVAVFAASRVRIAVGAVLGPRR